MRRAERCRAEYSKASYSHTPKRRVRCSIEALAGNDIWSCDQVWLPRGMMCESCGGFHAEEHLQRAAESGDLPNRRNEDGDPGWQGKRWNSWRVIRVLRWYDNSTG